jgi:hypothetical protein
MEDHPAELIMSCKGTPNFVAAEVEADLVLCALKIEVSMDALLSSFSTE